MTRMMTMVVFFWNVTGKNDKDDDDGVFLECDW